MTHPQAYHTSCRTGLSGQPGFQFNAASPSLDRTQLAALAAAHTGYHAPRDLPLEPTTQELEEFPVAMKVSTVDGVGPVASRTRYVGREFRGRNGAPDEGRFGNYFSHLVLGHGSDPFDGLLGVELWGAPHWRDEEADSVELEELSGLQPGPVDLPRVLDAIADAPAGVEASLLDAAMEAVAGGPRVVVVEGDAERRGAWIGWLSFALPLTVARELTFTTYDGRPRYALDVHVCVTTPACDVSFASHELGTTVRLIDATRAAPKDDRSLYARAAVALAARGPDALADAVRVLDTQPSRMRGAALAVVGRATDIVEPRDLPDVLELLVELAQGQDVARAAAIVDELVPAPTADQPTLIAWGKLHEAARCSSAGEPARDLAASALERLVPSASQLPREVPRVPPDAPTHPTVPSVAPWLGGVEANAGQPESGAAIVGGIQLGLVGVNAAVDRRVASALTAGVEHASVQNAIDLIAHEPLLEPVLIAVTEALADAAETDTRERSRLASVAQYPAATAGLRARAERLQTFDSYATWLRAEVTRDPTKRSAAAKKLVQLLNDGDPASEADIRDLWGPSGPDSEQDHHELLSTWLSAGRRPPSQDVDRALEQLATGPLREASPEDRLGATLARLGKPTVDHGAFSAWWTAAHGSSRNSSLRDWRRTAVAAFAAPESEVPPQRFTELLDSVGSALARRVQEADYEESFERLRRAVTPEDLDAAVSRSLSEALSNNAKPADAIAQTFVCWARMRRADELLEQVLPEAIKGHRKHDARVAELLPPRTTEAWERWVEAHPRGGVGGAIGRVLRRGRRDRGDEDKA